MKTKFASLVGMALLSTTVYAENMYVAVDAGQSKAADACTGIPAGVSCKNTGTAARIAGGYNFNTNFGLEASYTDYGKGSMSGTVLGFPVTGSFSTTAVQLAGVGMLPLNDSFSLTAKLGWASASVKASAAVGPVAASATSTNNNAVWGIGAQYNLTPTIGLRLNYEDLGKVGNAQTGKSKLTAVTGGVVVKF
ncbi:MAG: outer membrane beta-barrel protein [Pseudomonadota bacterium]